MYLRSTEITVIPRLSYIVKLQNVKYIVALTVVQYGDHTKTILLHSRPPRLTDDRTNITSQTICVWTETCSHMNRVTTSSRKENIVQHNSSGFVFNLSCTCRPTVSRWMWKGLYSQTSVQYCNTSRSSRIPFCINSCTIRISHQDSYITF